MMFLLITNTFLISHRRYLNATDQQFYKDLFVLSSSDLPFFRFMIIYILHRNLLKHVRLIICFYQN